MPNLSIKDVPETWAAALRQRAARHHRSLQGELMAILQAAIEYAPVDAPIAPRAPRAPGTARQTDENGRIMTRRGTKTLAQIHFEHASLFPQALTGGPLSVDLIRKDRDSR